MHIKSTEICCVLMLIGSMAKADHVWEQGDLENGSKLYADYCASCHGANLEGQANWQTPDENGILPAPPHDATGHTWHHDTHLLIDYVQLGGKAALEKRGIGDFPSGMPGFRDILNEKEVLDILSFIRSTWPIELQAVQAQRSQPSH